MSVTVYSTPGCQPCRSTYRELDRHGVEYEKIEVTDNEELIASLRAQGFAQFPVVIAGEQSWSGFRPDLIREHFVLNQPSPAPKV